METKIFIHLLLSGVQGFLMLYYGIVLSYVPDYFLDTEQYDPFAHYIRHPLIATAIICQFILLVLYLLYLFRFWKLFRVTSKVYSTQRQFVINVFFLSAIVLIKAVELVVRPTFYYGEVSDKHANNEMYFLLYPTVFVLYVLFDKYYQKRAFPNA